MRRLVGEPGARLHAKQALDPVTVKNGTRVKERPLGEGILDRGARLLPVVGGAHPELSKNEGPLLAGAGAGAGAGPAAAEADDDSSTPPKVESAGATCSAGVTAADPAR